MSITTGESAVDAAFGSTNDIGIVVGAIGGGVFVLALIAVAIYYVVRMRRASRLPTDREADEAASSASRVLDEVPSESSQFQSAVYDDVSVVRMNL
jgi:flagellar biogenesis protein FliO